MTSTKLVLASASPRRSQILKQLGLDFVVCAADIPEEILPEESTSEYVVRLSFEKALKIQESYSDAIVIGGDTIVWTGKEILGKPNDEKQALEMLLRLSGRTHRVFSGLTVALPSGKIVSDFASTEVRFRSFGREFAEAYVATGEPMDKAGAYGIQELGTALVESISGDFYTVVGLPVPLLLELFKRCGLVYSFGPLKLQRKEKS